MKQNLGLWVSATLGMVATLILNSCAYDPNYVSTSVGGSYSSGYGPGYGYGGDSFSSSVFVNTGNPRWGYDPGCYSYYDYHRRAYYDPYLNGYYPIGYRPPVVYGVSHPYGWHSGLAYCRPPSRVTNVTISNYRSREASYRSAGYVVGGRAYTQRPGSGYYGGTNYQQPNSSPVQKGNYKAPLPGQDPRSGIYRESNTQQGSRYPSRYNNPVSVSQPNFTRGSQLNQGDPRGGPRAQKPAVNQVQPLAPPDRTGDSRSQRSQPQRAAPPQQEAVTNAQESNQGGDPRGQRRR